MIVYRIVNEEKRSRDITGTGSFKFGGRWNNPGVFALYTSEHEALCLLELLVHIDEDELPEKLYIMEILIADDAPILTFREKDLPDNWRLPDNIQLKQMGGKIFKEGKVLGICAPSAVLPQSNNYIFNPEYKDFKKMVSIKKVYSYAIDGRLKK